MHFPKRTFFVAALVIAFLFNGVAVASAAQDGTTSGTPQSVSGVLGYVYVEQPSVSTSGIENIAVGFVDTSLTASSATLTYENETTGASYNVSDNTMTAGGVSFALPGVDVPAGEYRLVSMSYTAANTMNEVVFSGEGIMASFSVTAPEGTSTTDTTAYVVKNGQLIQTGSVAEAVSLASVDNTSGIKVALDPGHCDVHTGASNGDLDETELDLKVANACKAELETYNGVSVYMTRTTNACPYPNLNEYDDIRARIQAAVAWGANVYVCIHFNSFTADTANGEEVYYSSTSPQASSSEALAEQVDAQLAALGLIDRGVKDAQWIACQYAGDYGNIPGILIEHAFLTGSSDYTWLQNPANIKALGVADATAVADYYGLTKGTFTINASTSDAQIALTSSNTSGSSSTPSAVSYCVIYDNTSTEKWYASTCSGSIYSATVPVSDFGGYGSYRVQVWARYDSASASMMGCSSFTVSAPSATVLAISDTNASTVTASASVTASTGIDHVSFAITCAATGATRWVAATKQANGNYAVTVNISDFSGQQGTYSVEAWIADSLGLTTDLGGASVNVTPRPTYGNVSASTSGTSETLTLPVTANTSTVTNAAFAVTAGGTTHWYQAQSTNGSWTASIPFSDFGVYGTYSVQAWAATNGAAPSCVGTTSFAASAPTLTSLSATSTDSGASLTASTTVTAPSGVECLSYQVVSPSGTTRWYASTQAQDGSWDATIPTSDFGGQSGTYTVSAWMYDGPHILTLLGTTTTTLAATPIMGTSEVSVAQMVARFDKAMSSNGGTYPSAALGAGGAPDIETFCSILSAQAQREGVRADIVFAQAMHETGWLQFGGDVDVSQFNFAGLGATGGVPGNSFPDVATGLMAQIQHLKGYATSTPLSTTCVDPRYSILKSAGLIGSAPTVEELSMKWAASSSYGSAIITILDSML
jgi:N-acetylmuramoyl-L-alanine amidase